MTVSLHSVQALMGKIQLLSTDRLAEVEDFVDFLQQRTQTKKNSST